MFSGNWKLRISLLALLAVAVASIPAFAGSAVVGSVAGSMNATISGQALLPNTTVFSGDSLQVKDGAAVVAVGNGSRLVFGRETMASFLREASEVTVLLDRGNVSVYRPEAGIGLRVKAGDISIVPAEGFKTLGEVAMLNGLVVVTAKEGKLRVEGRGSAVEVAKGKTITVQAKPAAGPQGAGSGAAAMSASTALQVGSVATGVTSAVLSGVAISRAGDARDAAAQANSTAGQAVTAANAATAAADAAASAANDVGCALNNFASPSQPYSGTCD
jgi:hypothetical protein